MSRSIWQLAAAGLVLLIFGALPLMTQESKPKAGGENITGCLQKGNESGGYFLKAGQRRLVRVVQRRQPRGSHRH